MRTSLPQAPPAPSAPAAAAPAHHQSVAVRPGEARCPPGSPGLRQRLEGELRMGAWTACCSVPLLAAVAPLTRRLGAALPRAPMTAAGLPMAGAGLLDAGLTLRDYIMARRQTQRLCQRLHASATLAGQFRQRWKARSAGQRDWPNHQARALLAHDGLQAQFEQAGDVARRMHVPLLRDTVLQSTDAGLSTAGAICSLGGLASNAAAVGSWLSPVLGIMSGLLHMVQGVLDWRSANRNQQRARAAAETGRTLSGAALLRSLARPVALPPGELARVETVYDRLHQHFHANQLAAVAHSGQGKWQAACRMAYGAVTTPLTATALALALTGIGLASAGIGVALTATCAGIVWLAYACHRAYQSRCAAQQQARRNSAEAAQLALLQQAGASLEHCFTSNDSSQARHNGQLAVAVLFEHLQPGQPRAQRPAGAALRRAMAKAYLRHTGMPDITLKALCHSGADASGQAAARAALARHLLGDAARQNGALPAMLN